LKVGDFVKSLADLGQAGVLVSTPHSSGFTRLAFEAFYCLVSLGHVVVHFPTFYGIIKIARRIVL